MQLGLDDSGPFHAVYGGNKVYCSLFFPNYYVICLLLLN